MFTESGINGTITVTAAYILVTSAVAILRPRLAPLAVTLLN